MCFYNSVGTHASHCEDICICLTPSRTFLLTVLRRWFWCCPIFVWFYDDRPQSFFLVFYGFVSSFVLVLFCLALGRGERACLYAGCLLVSPNFWVRIWAATWQNQQSKCAPSENSDKPGNPPSLIRIFAVRMNKAWVLSCPLSAQWRLWSDWADAQTDLSLRLAYTHFVGFVMSWLNFYTTSLCRRRAAIFDCGAAWRCLLFYHTVFQEWWCFFVCKALILLYLVHGWKSNTFETKPFTLSTIKRIQF